MKPEAIVESYLCEQAEILGFLCYKFTSPGHNGVPDRILIGHGTTFFVETKAVGGKPRKLQRKVIARINDYGGIAFVASSKHDVDAIFEHILSQKTSRLRMHKKWMKELFPLLNK